ncbi:MAG: stage II sporulation protein R [Clostridia bacterium]|nr:stage II sporulation protein R [Clostridia bacterium]
MKAFIYCITSLLLVTLVIAAVPTESEAAIYEDTVRLHILASSDKDEDQEIKLAIRDRVLEKYGTALKGYSDADEAENKIGELLKYIESDVDVWLCELGADYTSTVTLGREWYDTREYEDFTLPKGIYTSLIIELGEGAGKNWWCVMFPPMCLDIATESAPADDATVDYTNEETRLISGGGYSIKFKLLELVSEVASKISKNG